MLRMYAVKWVVAQLQVRGATSTVEKFMARLFHGGGPSKIGNGTNRTGGSTILKLIWEGNLLYFPGFGDPQPYETWIQNLL